MAELIEYMDFSESENYKKSNHPNSYKWCFVPKCPNTSIRTPEKLFFSVRKDFETRMAWFLAARRQRNVSDTSTLYCCEDHFDPAEDVENWMQYKLMGGNIKLRIKPGVVPHKFDCQKDKKRASSSPTGTYILKRCK